MRMRAISTNVLKFRSVVCLPVCLSVGREPCKTAELIEKPLGRAQMIRVDQKHHLLDEVHIGAT